MKHVLVFVFFLFALGKTYAQSWNGDVRWLYDQFDFSPMPNDFVEIVKVKDTIIQNRKCAVFEQRYLLKNQNVLFVNAVNARHILAKENGKIDCYVHSENIFIPLYDFNAKAGESFKTSHFYTSPYQTFNVKVDSVKQELILGQKRRIQYVKGFSNGVFMEGKVIEDLGNDFFLFPTPGFVDPPPGGNILCYSDENQVASTGMICDLKLEVADQEKNVLNLYPIPMFNVLNVDGLPFFEYKIFSIDGLLLQKGMSVDKQIDVEMLDPGIYLFQIQYKEQIYQQKIVKN